MGGVKGKGIIKIIKNGIIFLLFYKKGSDAPTVSDPLFGKRDELWKELIAVGNAQ